MKTNSTCVIVLITCLLSGLETIRVSAQEKTGQGYAFDQNVRLGRGVNILGYDPRWKDPAQARMKEKHFRLIREAGFNNVRIKISPFKFSTNDTTYAIHPDFFVTLDWAIQEALKNNLMAIVDFHEHTTIQKDPVGIKPMLLSMWKQIAEHCKAYSNDVLFEIFNEPNMKPEVWNEMHREAYRIIRASNPNRTLIIGTINGNQIRFLKDLSLPDLDRNIIVAIHYYSPIQFTHQGAPWSLKNKDLSGITWTNTKNEEQVVNEDFDMARAWSEANHRPLTLGEFGAYEKADMPSRARWTSYIARQAEARTWSWSYWQFDSDFIVYDIHKEEWILPLKNALLPGNDYPFDDRTSFTPITNRQNLGSWKMQGKGDWSVEQGVLVGRQDPSESQDSWLFSSAEWEDFALELEFLIPEKCNSGIGIRMPKDSVGSPDVHGYEVQISDLPQRKLTGSLLHHAASGGNNRLQPGVWNRLAIICEGDHIRVYLNRQKVLDEKVNGSKKGRIGLQVPKDPEFSQQVVRFRELRVKDLSPVRSFIPAQYTGRPFVDSIHTTGPQVIPGKIECAFYDLGGEGVAYGDFESENRGSGGLNINPHHQRPHALPYLWEFRKEEGVDVSYTKDFADFNHPNNFYNPEVNQLYVGWTEDKEWLNYTVDVKAAGTYKLEALYANKDTTITFDINQKPAGIFKLPLNTGHFHIWNKAEIGRLSFNEPGLHLLTFHYNKYNNFAYFEFTLVEKKTPGSK